MGQAAQEDFQAVDIESIAKPVTVLEPPTGGHSRMSRACGQAQPSSRIAQPAFQILVMWLIFPAANRMT